MQATIICGRTGHHDVESNLRRLSHALVRAHQPPLLEVFRLPNSFVACAFASPSPSVAMDDGLIFQLACAVASLHENRICVWPRDVFSSLLFTPEGRLMITGAGIAQAMGGHDFRPELDVESIVNRCSLSSDVTKHIRNASELLLALQAEPVSDLADHTKDNEELEDTIWRYRVEWARVSFDYDLATPLVRHIEEPLCSSSVISKEKIEVREFAIDLKSLPNPVSQRSNDAPQNQGSILVKEIQQKSGGPLEREEEEATRTNLQNETPKHKKIVGDDLTDRVTAFIFRAAEIPASQGIKTESFLSSFFATSSSGSGQSSSISMDFPSNSSEIIGQSLSKLIEDNSLADDGENATIGLTKVKTQELRTVDSSGTDIDELFQDLRDPSDMIAKAQLFLVKHGYFPSSVRADIWSRLARDQLGWPLDVFSHVYELSRCVAPLQSKGSKQNVHGDSNESDLNLDLFTVPPLEQQTTLDNDSQQEGSDAQWKLLMDQLDRDIPRCHSYRNWDTHAFRRVLFAWEWFDLFQFEREGVSAPLGIGNHHTEGLVIDKEQVEMKKRKRPLDECLEEMPNHNLFQLQQTKFNEPRLANESISFIDEIQVKERQPSATVGTNLSEHQQPLSSEEKKDTRAYWQGMDSLCASVLLACNLDEISALAVMNLFSDVVYQRQVFTLSGQRGLERIGLDMMNRLRFYDPVLFSHLNRCEDDHSAIHMLFLPWMIACMSHSLPLTGELNNDGLLMLMDWVVSGRMTVSQLCCSILMEIRSDILIMDRLEQIKHFIHHDIATRILLRQQIVLENFVWRVSRLGEYMRFIETLASLDFGTRNDVPTIKECTSNCLLVELTSFVESVNAADRLSMRAELLEGMDLMLDGKLIAEAIDKARKQRKKHIVVVHHPSNSNLALSLVSALVHHGISHCALLKSTHV